MTPSDERERVIHRLAGLLTVTLANCAPLLDELTLLKGGAAMQPALDILVDIESAARQAVQLFPELRRVVQLH